MINRDYITRCAAALSQGANALIGGHNDMTLSARAHVQAHLGPRRRFWGGARWVINGLFFWDADHCRSSWARDEKWAAEVRETAVRLRGRGVN